jgi:AcrR family transcriptional regulator
MGVATKRRLTQAERSANTRARVLKAAIRCLHIHGYAATTTLLVAEQAKISRGAMLHQFPTKTDLMLFVVRSVFDDEVARYEACRNTPNHTNADFQKVMWDTVSGPAGIAVLEIMLGSRSDRQLAQKLIPLQAEIEREQAQVAKSMQAEGHVLGTLNGVRLITWALRGFAMANVIAENPHDTTDVVDLFWYVLATYRDLDIPKPNQQKKVKPEK